MAPYWTFPSLVERDAQEIHPTEVGQMARLLEGSGPYFIARSAGKGPQCWGLGALMPLQVEEALGGYHVVGGVVPLTDAPTIQTNGRLGSVFSVTLHGNRILANPMGLVPGGRYLWLVRQDAIGNRTLSLRPRWRTMGGVCPLSPMPGSLDLIDAWSDGTLVYVTSITQNVS